MKNLITVLLFAAFIPFLSAGPDFQMKPESPRSVKQEKTAIPMMKKGEVVFQLYVPSESSGRIKKRAERFAAYLSEITGMKTSPVNKLPEGSEVTVLRFGDAAFARAQKIDLAKIDRDGFVIAAFGRHILLAGRDAQDTAGGEGTFYAALDFLERFADARFYFPGKYGTLLPRKKDWQVPSMTIYDRPDFQIREIYWGPTKWYDSAKSYGQTLDDHKRELRFSSRKIPTGHMLAWMNYPSRFAKTHPEYFAVDLNGTRCDGSVVRYSVDVKGHPCFSSGIMEEIYQDAKAILTLPGPEAIIKKRNMSGVSKWMVNTKPFFLMMPNDCMVRCRCKKCAPYYEGLDGDKNIYYSEKAGDFTWEKLLYVPNRLEKEKVPGIVLMMAYDLTRQVPKQKIPDNVMIQLAALGPWGELNKEKQIEDEKLMQRWVEKLGSKIWLWNYTTKTTAGARGVDFVPNFTPNVIGRYYKQVQKYSFGAFLESETDYWIFSHLNNYVFCRLMWDGGTDADSLLADYRKRMFGPGAAPMKEIMDSLEEHWMKDILNNVVETSIGPVTRPPSEYAIWNKIYSPRETARINGLFDKAEKLASKDSGALGRIRFMRKALWGPLNDAANDYFKKAAAVEYWQSDVGTLKEGEKITVDGVGNEKAWADAPFIALLPLGRNEAEVLTFVKMLHDKENLYFLFDCREPFTDKMLGTKRKSDDPDMWSENAVEIHLDPAGNRKENHQFMIDRFGDLTDLRITNTPLKFDYKWNSGAETKTTLVPGKGWFAEVRIPLKSLPAVKDGMIVANFNRHRFLNGVNVHKTYTWSPYVKSFGDQRHFGSIHLGARKSENMLIDSDFVYFGYPGLKSGKSAWTFGRPAPKRDVKCFRTKGVSLMLEGHRCGMYHQISGLKPNTTYRLSFFVRQDNVQLNQGASPQGSGFFVHVSDGNKVFRALPARPFFGTIPWTRWEFTYRTSAKQPGTVSKPYIHFVLRSCSGKVWVDKAELVELPKPEKAAKR